MNPPLFAGIDAGTSGIRLVLIDAMGTIYHEATLPLQKSTRTDAEHEQDPDDWWDKTRSLLKGIPQSLKPSVLALAIDGTSGTLLACDKSGTPLAPALMYDDARAIDQSEKISAIAPVNSAAHGSSSGLAKLLWYQEHLDQTQFHFALNQADWLLGQITGCFGISDENNCLKLGYDPATRRWPEWLNTLGIDASRLPVVHEPGTAIMPIAPACADELGLPANMMTCSGTTDSIAAFLATGANQTGAAVTSLGSTLAIKVLCKEPLFDPQAGIYSHRIWDQWLVGGASNSGGAALLKYFSLEEIRELSQKIDPAAPSGLEYYPLPAKGERFPIYDPDKPSLTEPRPLDDALFLQGLLEGVARIEKMAYAHLQALGAPALEKVITVGGGSTNALWTRIRRNILKIPVETAEYDQAAYGAALLARRGILHNS
jgi:hypothetical protein